MRGRGWWLAAGLASVAVLPVIAVQALNLGLIREGRRARKEVALTFDDGPDPETTPRVLDALRNVGAQATFFVMAGRAEAHPDLIRRMRDEGHEVGAHAVRHRHGWGRSPWDALRDPGDAAARIGRVAGSRVRLHRPPHGAYTVFTVAGQRLAGLQGVHWSLEGQDWKTGQTSAQVRERLEQLVVPGAIVVLHDAGPGALRTAALLPDLLRTLGERGYTFRTVSDLHGGRPVGWPELKRRIAGALDAVFDHLGGAVWPEDRQDRLLRFVATRFPLADVRLPNGGPVPRGAPAIEFHANNAVMADLGLVRALYEMRRDLRWLAARLQQDPSLPCEWIYCLSSLPALVSALKFTNVPLTGFTRWRLRTWANVLRWAFGSEMNAPDPVLSVLSREEFLRRYGTPESSGKVG